MIDGGRNWLRACRPSRAHEKIANPRQGLWRRTCERNSVYQSPLKRRPRGHELRFYFNFKRVDLFPALRSDLAERVQFVDRGRNQTLNVAFYFTELT